MSAIVSSSLIRRSIARGSHFSGLQFTHWSALAVRKFWSAVYPLVRPADRRSALCHSPKKWNIQSVSIFCL